MKYILPGMGANSEMYAGPWRRIEDARFINWPSYNSEISITDMANSLIDKYQISRNDILIGSSLGGMVSLEIDDIVGLKKVFLVGSALNPSELSSVSRLLIPLAGRPVVKISQMLSSLFEDIIHKMYSNSDPDFIVSMSKAIMNWRGFSGELNKVARIHGKRDSFITCPMNCTVIDDGGHLIAITHAHECVDFVCKTLSEK